MPEQGNSSSLQKTQSLALKALALSAVGMFIGFGACSLGALSYAKATRPVQLLTGAAVWLFFVSLAIFVVSGLVLFAIIIVKAFRR